ncbi:MAG TPA: hypothetical protein VER55_08255, partial [Ardenticatenaceae bacterium]|nr:hypothetical protein [Ardenticatenaceae bacterium]
RAGIGLRWFRGNELLKEASTGNRRDVERWTFGTALSPVPGEQFERGDYRLEVSIGVDLRDSVEFTVE